MSNDLDVFLRSTATIDCDSGVVQAFVHHHCEPNTTATERAVSLYYAVRDQLRYDPYTISVNRADYAASQTLAAGRGWCVTKAIVYAACCRAIGVPARLGYANVRNHLSTANLRRLMGTDIFYWHGYTDVYLNSVWVKATPAFNVELCRRLRLQALEFDGLEDSIFQPFDLDGQKHMEYLHYHGEFADLPFDQMMHDLSRFYPNFKGAGDFDREVTLETSVR